MNKNENAKMEIQKGIEIFTKDAISKAPFDVTEIGVINSSTQNGYSVKIKGKTYNNVKTNGGTCTIGEVVKVLVPQNQYNNMFILKSGSGSSSSGVSSVNGKTGNVILNASDVGALPSTTVIPNKTSQLTNDSNYVSDINYVHTDNNYTTTEKNKLSNIESNAQINTVNSVDGEQGNIELNDVKYTTQTLTDNQKTQARTNIGAGTSSFSGDYSDLSNKPTIPTVGNGTITFTQNGTSKGTITTNQSGDTTIALTDNNTTYDVATSTTLGLVKSGTDITIDASGNVSVNDNSHNHTKSNITDFPTSMTPISHASTTTTYGVSSSSNYGHAMASNSTPLVAGTASVGIDNGRFAREGHVHPLQTRVTGSSGNCTGNSATATKLQTPRTIMGVPFDGTANILEDTGWVEFGPSLYMSNLTAWSAYQIPKYRKIGSVVYISGALRTTSVIPATSEYNALVLPQEIWVNNSTNARSVNPGSGMNRVFLMVGGSSSTQYLQFGNYGTTMSIDIPSGSYINLSMMYMTLT